MIKLKTEENDKEIRGKSKNSIIKKSFMINELIKGEVYNVGEPSNTNLFMWGGRDSTYYMQRWGKSTNFVQGQGAFVLTPCTKLATPEEKLWLLICINANRLVSLSEIQYEIY